MNKKKVMFIIPHLGSGGAGRKEVEGRNFKETYVFPYNNQEYKRYECPNCNVHWWEQENFFINFCEWRESCILN
jgi:hypothetical protein